MAYDTLLSPGRRMESSAPLPERILDLGCGFGEALLPLLSAAPPESVAIGIDVSPLLMTAGLHLTARQAPHALVAFLAAAAERLPFASESFDLIHCSLTLPYTDNARCLAEVARLLHPDGRFRLRIHHARFYLRKLQRGLLSGDWRAFLYAARVLLSGTLLLLTHRQPQEPRLRECFQTRWLLRRELAKCGLVIDFEEDPNPLTPAFTIRKLHTTADQRGEEKP